VNYEPKSFVFKFFSAESQPPNSALLAQRPSGRGGDNRQPSHDRRVVGRSRRCRTASPWTAMQPHTGHWL